MLLSNKTNEKFKWKIFLLINVRHNNTLPEINRDFVITICKNLLKKLSKTITDTLEV